MTIRELIELLEEQEPEMEICLYDSYGEFIRQPSIGLNARLIHPGVRVEIASFEEQ